MNKILSSRRSFLSGLLVTTGFTCLGACSSNRATGRNSLIIGQSLQDDVKIGRQEHGNILSQFGGEYQDKNLKQYINVIGQKLAQHSEYKEFTYHFTILDTPTLNAFALPGGFIYITRGLLALIDNEAELAGVLSHEIGHVTARHAAERLGRGTLIGIGSSVLGAVVGSQQIGKLAAQGGQLYLKGFSRDQEYEADLLGLRYLLKAGYHPQGSVDLLHSLNSYTKLDLEQRGLDPNQNQAGSLLATHPRTADRIEKARDEVEKTLQHNQNRLLVINSEAYLNNINNMIFGDNAQEGFVRGQDFIHTIDGYRFTVPKGFILENTTRRLSANHRDGYEILFNISRLRHYIDPKHYIIDQWQNKRRLNSLQRIKVNNHDAAIAELDGRINNNIVRIAMVAIEGKNNMIYRFVFSAPRNRYNYIRPAFHKTLHSFRFLTDKEKKLYKPKRLKIIANNDFDINSHINKMGFGEFNKKFFDVLNDTTQLSQVKVISS